MKAVITVLVLSLAARAHADAFAGIGAGLFVPPSGGKLGGALHVDAGYEWSLPAIAFAPGVRFSGFLGPEDALAGLVTLRTSLLRPIARPYLLIAAGPGHHERRQLALEAGAGLSFPVLPHLLVGGEGSYVQFGHGSFRSVYVGPMLQLSF